MCRLLGGGIMKGRAKKEEEGGRERERKMGMRKGRQTDFRRKGKTRELI